MTLGDRRGRRQPGEVQALLRRRHHRRRVVDAADGGLPLARREGREVRGQAHSEAGACRGGGRERVGDGVGRRRGGGGNGAGRGDGASGVAFAALEVRGDETIPAAATGRRGRGAPAVRGGSRPSSGGGGFRTADIAGRAKILHTPRPSERTPNGSISEAELQADSTLTLDATMQKTSDLSRGALKGMVKFTRRITDDFNFQGSQRLDLGTHQKPILNTYT